MLFVGYALPNATIEDIFMSARCPAVAANNHQWNIIRGIEAASEEPVDLISSYPVSEYPGYRHILVGYSRWSHRPGSQDIIVPFINILILKHITQFVSFLFLISFWLLRSRRSINRKVLVYETYSPHFVASIVATRLFGGEAILVVPDLPMGSSAPKNPIKRVLKPLNSYFVLKMMRLAKGLVVLTRQTAEDYAARLPYVVVEAIAPTEYPDGAVEISERNEKIVMYAGLLQEEYGVRLLLEDFKLIPDSRYRLWIFGRGQMEQQVKEAAAEDDRITYWGFLPNESVMRKAVLSTVLVNPRPARQRFTLYSFPSKIVEYMATGRPVISTALPGIPEEYNDYLYSLKNETPGSLAAKLQQVCSKDPEELCRFGKRARDFVLENKNYLRQGKKIYDFLENI